MNPYELRYKVNLIDPNTINFTDYKFNRIRTNKINLADDKSNGIHINKIDKKSSEVDISVIVQANTLNEALSAGAEKLNQYLDFYSVFSYLEMEIKDFFNSPYLVIDIKKSKKYHKPFVKTFGIIYPPKLMTKLMSQYRHVIAKTGNEYLQVAFSFMRDSRLSKTPEARILNCFVVLEALYSKNEERTEMTYRISNRMSTLLAKNKDERLKLLKQIKTLYGTRSLIVHGSSGGKKIDQWYIVPLTRESIMRFLKLSTIYSSHQEIVDKIDEAMLENSIREKLHAESNFIFSEGNRQLLSRDTNYIEP